jgi:hypothetical protein
MSFTRPQSVRAIRGLVQVVAAVLLSAVCLGGQTTNPLELLKQPVPLMESVRSLLANPR